MAGKAILLNGVSSAGKTTVAKEIQNESETIFYHLQIDDFICMAGERACKDDLLHVFAEAVSNYVHTANIFCSLGRNIILDTVCVTDGLEMIYSIIDKLSEYDVLIVKVDCSMDELEKREKERGDRAVGQARWQTENSHDDILYDVIVDTSTEKTKESAARILATFDKTNSWNGFSKLILNKNNYKGK